MICCRPAPGHWRQHRRDNVCPSVLTAKAARSVRKSCILFLDVTNRTVPRMHILHGNTRECKTEMIKFEARYSIMASFAQPRNTSCQVGSLRNSEIGTGAFESCGRLILFVRFFATEPSKHLKAHSPQGRSNQDIGPTLSSGPTYGTPSARADPLCCDCWDEGGHAIAGPISVRLAAMAAPAPIRKSD